MTDDRKISIAIPTWNRVEMTIEAFMDVYDDDRISEIVIVDDASDLEVFTRLKELCDNLSKVKLYRNLTNQDCYRNKMTAISYVSNDRCILLDSDNKIGKDYINRLYEIPEWDYNTIYTPDFAEPSFSFQQFSGLLVTKGDVSNWIDEPMFEVMLNASNYFVNRNEFLKVWDGSTDPVTSDSIFTAYNWLNAGNKIIVVDGLHYQHRVHNGHYQTNVHRTPVGFHDSVLNKLRQLT